MRENDRRRLYIRVTTKKALLVPKYATRSSLRGEANSASFSDVNGGEWFRQRDELYSTVN